MCIRDRSKAIGIGDATRVTTTATIVTDVKHSFVAGETVVVAGCGDPFDGSHTIATVTAADKKFTYTVADEDLEINVAAGTAIVDKAPTSQDYVNSAETSREMLETVLTDEEIALGSSDGYVYQLDADVTTDDGETILTAHITEVIDAGKPGWEKIWPALRYTAKGTTITVSYRIASFETTGTGWVDFDAQTLTSEFVEYFIPINDTSKKIQFKFSGGPFVLSNYELDDPVFLSR